MSKEYVHHETGEIIERPEPFEVLDPTPVAIPARLKRVDNLNEVVRQMVRSEELRRLADAAGEETFEEADDFEVGDDYEPSSPYEEIFEGDVLKDAYARQQILEAGVRAAAAKQEASASPPAATAPEGETKP